jgi:hypothetical protein
MNSFLRACIVILPVAFSRGHATLPDYVWGLAPFGYQNLNAIQIKLTEKASLYGNRGDVYQYKSSRMNNESKWIGWDFGAGLQYQLLQNGSFGINAGAAYHLTLRSYSFFESDPSVQFDFTVPAGPVSLEWRNSFQIRYVQNPSSGDGNKFRYYRWEPQLRISTKEEWTKLNLTPYLSWQGHLQNKSSQPVYALNMSSLENYKVPFYNEVEAGLQARLSRDIGLGMGDKFMFLPTRTKTGCHRLTTYLTWYFDLSQNPGN